MATLSVEQAFSQVEAVERNISNIPEPTRLFYASAVERETRKIVQSYDPELLISENTINVVANTSAYALPANFGDINYPGTGIFTVDSDGNTEDRTLPMTSIGSKTRGFWVDATNNNLTPIPQAVETLIQRYMTKFVKFTAIGNTFTVSDEWEELIVNGLLVRVAQFQRNPTKEAEAGNRYANSTSEFIKSINRTPKVFRRKDRSSFF